MLCKLTHSAMATTPAQNSVGLPAQSKAAIGWGDEQPHLMAYRQIVEIITHEGGTVRCRTHMLLELGQGCRLVFDANETVLDAQLMGPNFGGPPFATAQESQV